MTEHESHALFDAAPERLVAFLAQALLVTLLALAVHVAATNHNTFAHGSASAEGSAYLAVTLRQPLVPVVLASAALLDVLLFGLAAAARAAAGHGRPWPTRLDTAAAMLVLACLWSVLLGVMGGLLRGPAASTAPWEDDALATCLALIPYAVGREILFRHLHAAHERTRATVYLALAWSCRKEALFNLLTVLTVLAGALGLPTAFVAWGLGLVKIRFLGAAVVHVTRTAADEGGLTRGHPVGESRQGA